MDSAAEYYAEALDCETKAYETQDTASRALFLTVAARWRVMAGEAAEKESNRRSTSSASLAA